MTDPALLTTYRRIVFSDVDGTLIDSSGRVPAAWPSIRHAMRDALLVLTSSRTVEELLDVQHVLGIDGPFIAENGAMLVLMNEWLEHAQGTVVQVAGRMLRLIPIGTPGTHLSSIVRAAADVSGIVIETHRDVMTADLPAVASGESRASSYALARSHSLLLRIGGTAASRLRFFGILAAAGLTVTHGGRWHVVQGGSDKGIAARALVQLLRRRLGDDLCIIGVGDAQNDRSLLESAHLRFVLRRPDGTVDPELSEVPDAYIAEAAGLDGWVDVLPRMHPASTEGRQHD